MKAIVLGATGFIGSHIVRALQEEEIDVRILRRSSSPTLALEGLKVENVMGDLNDKTSLLKAFRGCQVLFFAAGYYPLYSFEKEKQKAIALRQMNNVLETAGEADIQKIIYTSSMSTIGNPPQSPFFKGGSSGSPPFAKGGSGGFLANEETPYDPRHFRGAYYEIKHLLEQEAIGAAARGLPITIVNPTGVFGDGDIKPTSGTIVVAIAQKKVPAIFDAPTNAVDVRDVGRGHIAAMKKGRAGRRYILGGHNTTVWEMAHLIARLAKVPPPKLKLPLLLGKVAAPLSEVIGKYLLHQDKPFLPRVGIDFLKYGMHYDTTRAQKELGFTVTPLKETFERAIAWFRKNNYI